MAVTNEFLNLKQVPKRYKNDVNLYKRIKIGKYVYYIDRDDKNIPILKNIKVRDKRYFTRGRFVIAIRNNSWVHISDPTHKLFTSYKKALGVYDRELRAELKINTARISRANSNIRVIRDRIIKLHDKKI